MSLEFGTKLGPYEIQTPIGAGGMGEVYKANDTRLDRVVAVKVLPEHLAEDDERKQRFEREAKAISQLNHPHICTLYDVGEQDGIDYLVMEYIEGATLADALQSGALPIDKALEYATQIADALDKAHRAGIVHRDLKPANIIITKSGVKLLDFGLARLVVEESVSDASDALTKQQNLTKDHTVVGTLHYMSPEQLEGKTIDSRADLFAFGAVLYEMLTGKGAFEGDSTASVITAIMSSEPRPVSELRTVAPAALDRVVKKSLEKDRNSRWQTALDLRDEIVWVREGGGKTESASAPKGSRHYVVLAATALIAAVATWAMTSREISTDAPMRHFTVPIPSGVVLPPGRGVLLTIAQNGSRIAFMGEREGVEQLFARAAADRDFVAIPGTEGARHPSLSPDGEQLAFDLLGQPFALDFVAGRVTPIADRGLYPTWGPDGSIYYWSDGIWRAPTNGGTPEELVSFPVGQSSTGLGRLKVLPNGDAVLFEVSDDDAYAVNLLTLDSLEIRTLVTNGGNPRYLASGHVVFTRDDDVLAVPFDADSLRITGDEFPLGRDIRVESGAAGHFDVTAGGTLVYAERVASDGRLVRVDFEGNPRPLIDTVGEFGRPSSSPDGGRIAVVQQRDLWILDVARGVMSRLTFERRSTGPVWSPDTSELVFTGGRLGLGGAGYVSRVASVGTATPTTIAADVPFAQATSWSPNGDTLLVETLQPDHGWDIQRLSVDDGEISTFVSTPFNEHAAKFSPDGRFVAYESDESGRYEVFVVSYPGAAQKLQISDDGGRYPIWSRSGDTVFYRDVDAMMAVSVDTRDEFVPQKARVLFEAPFARRGPHYDVLGDNEGFVMVETETLKEGNELHVIQNWFEELPQIAPAKN